MHQLIKGRARPGLSYVTHWIHSWPLKMQVLGNFLHDKSRIRSPTWQNPFPAMTSFYFLWLLFNEFIRCFHQSFPQFFLRIFLSLSGWKRKQIHSWPLKMQVLGNFLHDKSRIRSPTWQNPFPAMTSFYFLWLLFNEFIRCFHQFCPRIFLSLSSWKMK